MRSGSILFDRLRITLAATRPRALSIVVIALLFGVGWDTAFPSDARAQMAVQPMQQEGWIKICPKEQEDLSLCVVQLSVSVKNPSSGQATRILAYGLQYDEAGRVAGQIIVTPLSVLLRRGVDIQIDGRNSLNIPYTLCSRQGCTALWPADTATVGDLIRGNWVRVGYHNAKGEPLDITVSLEGFSNALASVPTAVSP